MTVQDEQLIRGALEGDRVAFGILVERYKRQVLGMCYSFAKDFHDTEDLAQIVFTKTYKSLANLENPGKFAAWLCKITYATCRDWLRKGKREAASLAELRSRGLLKKPLSEAIVAGEDLGKIIGAVLGELPENLQMVLAMRFYEDLTYRDIADFLDLPMSTVRGMIYRGTQLLRKRLTEYMNE